MGVSTGCQGPGALRVQLQRWFRILSSKCSFCFLFKVGHQTCLGKFAYVAGQLICKLMLVGAELQLVNMWVGIITHVIPEGLLVTILPKYTPKPCSNHCPTVWGAKYNSPKVLSRSRVQGLGVKEFSVLDRLSVLGEGGREGGREGGGEREREREREGGREGGKSCRA